MSAREEHVGRSPSELLVEPEPPVTLYAGERKATRQAMALLKAADIQFRLVSAGRSHPGAAGNPANDDRVAAEFGDLRYEGLEGVQSLVRDLSAMRSAFLCGVRRALPNVLPPKHAKDWVPPR